MRYFIDTEFIEDGKTIDLISIGIVAEDDRTYYAINRECQFQNANDWVWKNVLYPIGIYELPQYVNLSDPSVSALTKETLSKAKPRARIKEDLLIFFAGGVVDSDKDQSLNWDKAIKNLEIWGYYADYDWVVFCQLFGSMVDLPKGFPMYCRDVKQLCDDLDNPELPKQEHGEHNALEDARWTRAAFDHLVALRGRRGAS